MAANKTTKPSAKPTAKTTAKRVAETSKKVVAKSKATAKAPVKTKIVPKTTAKAPAAAQGKSAKAAAAANTAKGAPKIETNGKKSNVNLTAKKPSETKPVAQAAKAKATPVLKPAVADPRLAMAAKPAAAPLKSASAAKTVAAPAAKPGATKTAAQAKPTANPAQAKASPKAPSIVLPLKKLPVTGKPGAVAAKPAMPLAPAGKPAQPEAMALSPKVQMAAVVDPKKPVKPATQRHGFRTNEYIVYPSHGVGKIVRIEEQVVAGYSLELFVIHFEQEKMTLRVPTAKLASVGMRKLSELPIVERAMETLKGRARIKRTMWSRRAQEYEAKINSGDLVSIAEVVRDLYRAETQPEQSYSERQLFEAALDRMSREIAAIENLDDRGATQKVLDVLSKSAKNRKAIEAAAPEAAVNAGGAERAA